MDPYSSDGPKLSLTTIPKLVTKDILTFLDYRSILCLRKTCQHFKIFLDDVKPDLKLSNVNIEIFSNKVQLELNSRSNNNEEFVAIEYRNNRSGCLLTWKRGNNQKKKIIEDEGFLTVFCDDFEDLISYQKSTIEEMKLRFDHEKIDPISTEFYKYFKELLSTRKKQLQVKKIEYEISKTSEIMSTLPFINPNTLEKIWITSDNEGWDGWNHNKLDIVQLVQLEQWKKAKEVNLGHFVVTVPLSSFSHFDHVEVLMKDVEANDVLSLRDNILTSSSFEHFKFWFKKIENENFLLSTLGTPFLDTDRHGNKERKWFYRIPDRKEFLIMCQIPSKLFYFDVIDVLAVPMEALIME